MSGNVADNQRWMRLRGMFDRARSLNTRDRDSLVSEVAQEDPALAEELRQTLHSHQRHSNNTDRDREALLNSAIRLIDGPSLQVGSRVGAYVLTHELGRGGMGVVFLADRRDGRVQQKVAIKVLGRSALDTYVRRRFEQEREILASLDHPHIARLLDAGETAEGLPFYVMEFVDGTPITDHCNSVKAPIRLRLQLFLDVCEAVQYAHANLILHRDIKPGNVLVKEDEDAKLIDFGIAADLNKKDRTSTGQRFFSPINVAPEQLKGERVAVACDVYQLGTVLYELLSGKSVFEVNSLTPAQLEYQILYQPPPAPSSVVAVAGQNVAQLFGMSSNVALAKTLRGDLDNITLQALRKAPAERYQSVAALTSDIQCYLNRRPVLARKGHMLYRARKFIRRHVIGLSASVMMMIILLLTTTALWISSLRLTEQRNSAQQERDRATTAMQFLVNTFKFADPAVSLKHEMTVREALANGRHLLASESNQNADVRVQLLTSVAEIYLALEDIYSAREALEEAETLLDTTGEEQSRLALKILELKARIAGAMGDTRIAYSAATKAIDLHERLKDPITDQWAARNTQARALQDFGTSEEALTAYRSLYTQMQEFGGVEPRRLAGVEVQMAQLLAPQRDPFAETLFRRAVARLQATLPEEHPDLLWVRADLANYEDEALHRSSQALSTLQKILDQQQSVLGTDALMATPTLGFIADAYSRLGYHAASLAIGQSVLDRYSRLYKKPHVDVFQAMLHLGDYELAANELDRAADYFQRASALSVTLWGQQSEGAAVAVGRLGVVRAKQGDLSAAETLLERALQGTSLMDHAQLPLQIELAEVHARQGRMLEATAELEQGKLSIDKLSPRWDDLLDRIRHVRELMLTLGPASH